MTEKHGTAKGSQSVARSATDEAMLACDAFGTVCGAAIGAWRECSEASIRTTANVNKALVDYFGTWVDSTFKAQRSIFEGGMWAGMMGKHGDLMRTTTEQCFEESIRTLNFVGEAIQEISTPAIGLYAKGTQETAARRETA